MQVDLCQNFTKTLLNCLSIINKYSESSLYLPLDCWPGRMAVEESQRLIERLEEGA